MSKIITLLKKEKSIDHDSLGMICSKCGFLSGLILDNKNNDIGYAICHKKYKRVWEIKNE